MILMQGDPNQSLYSVLKYRPQCPDGIPRKMASIPRGNSFSEVKEAAFRQYFR
jgi:hypothetical protein